MNGPELIPEPPEGGREYKPIRTFPGLTKYEKARVLGTRATQIAKGAPVKSTDGTRKDPLELAEEELARGETPLIIRRPLPDGTYEDVAVRNLLEKRSDNT
jgi:DNA-directed RNA polymerase I, II, and III subunit RPABC2